MQTYMVSADKLQSMERGCESEYLAAGVAPPTTALPDGSMTDLDSIGGKTSGTDDEPTCPNGSIVCPVDNPARDDSKLECFDCYPRGGA